MTWKTPEEPHAREELVKNLMADAVLNDAGRPSVEALLHNILETKFVVHTHALLVNGMTRARMAKPFASFSRMPCGLNTRCRIHSLHGTQGPDRCLQGRAWPDSQDHHAQESRDLRFR